MTVIACAAIGCTNTTYEVAAPEQLRGPLPLNAGKPTSIDGIEYELFAAEGQGVIFFINRTGVPLRLTEASTIKDTTGRTFPIDVQTIPPNQSGRIIVPPSTPMEPIANRRAQPAAVEPQVGGIDEPGFINTGVIRKSNAADDPRGFRWTDGRRVTVHLEFEPERDATTETTTQPMSTIVQDISLVRLRD